MQWNDIVDTCNVKIEKVEPYNNDILNSTSSIRYSYRIASLKGQTPTIAISSNPPIGSKQNITAQIITEATYTNLYKPYSISTGWVNMPAEYYEWTLPPNWIAAGQNGTTFILKADEQKSITVTPNFVTAGEIKVRALNALRTAGSDMKSNMLDRGFNFTTYPTSITFGDNTSKIFSTTLFSGIIYEWKVPIGWHINGQGNTMEALNLNSVSITPSFCLQTDDKVLVRLKKDGDISSWYDCTNFQGILKPNKITSASTVYQYEEATFVINNINMAGIQSISSVDGKVVFTGDQNSGFKVVFLEAGTFTTNVLILMAGCDVPFQFPLSAKVLPHRIKVLGSSYVCPSSSTIFTAENAPQNYTWGYSSNLTPIGGSPGSFTTSFLGGVAWVSINAFGKECTRMNFIIGSEIIGLSQIINVQTNNRYYATPVCSNQNNIWVLSWQGMNMLTEKPDTVYGKNYVDIASTISPNNMTIYDLSLIQDNGYKPIKYISVTGVKLSLVGIKKPNPFPPIELLLYPNPVSDILRVEIKTDDSGIDSDNATLARNTNTDIESYTIQLWNEHRGLVRTIEVTESIQQISLQGLPNGMYFVHVVKDGKMLQRKIIWKN